MGGHQKNWEMWTNLILHSSLNLKTIKCERRHPRKTVKNKNQIGNIWGDKGKVDVYIPTTIDEYNHWMCGVDIVDQRIA
eukprot:3595441-Ditylum_brightwellii.AAC.1